MSSTSLQSDGERSLVGGWKKQIVIRKGGLSQGKGDVYLTSPPPKSKRLRSNIELLDFLADNLALLPTFDPIQVNFDKTFQVPLVPSTATKKVIWRLEQIKAGTYSTEKRKPIHIKPDKANKKGTKRIHFSKKRTKYLIRQHAKVSHPSNDQVNYMSLQLGYEPQDIRQWFNERNVKVELGTERPVKLFDVTNQGIDDPYPYEEPTEQFTIEKDNAELS